MQPVEINDHVGTDKPNERWIHTAKTEEKRNDIPYIRLVRVCANVWLVYDCLRDATHRFKQENTKVKKNDKIYQILAKRLCGRFKQQKVNLTQSLSDVWNSVNFDSISVFKSFFAADQFHLHVNRVLSLTHIKLTTPAATATATAKPKVILSQRTRVFDVNRDETRANCDSVYREHCQPTCRDTLCFTIWWNFIQFGGRFCLISTNIDCSRVSLWCVKLFHTHSTHAYAQFNRNWIKTTIDER